MGRDADLRPNLSIRQDVAHCERQDVMDADSVEPLRSDQGPVAWFQLANDAKELPFLDAG
jgi:hypothetical protein